MTPRLPFCPNTPDLVAGTFFSPCPQIIVSTPLGGDAAEVVGDAGGLFGGVEGLVGPNGVLPASVYELSKPNSPENAY